MAWENIHQMIPDSTLILSINNNEQYSINDIKNSDIISLERLYVKPTRNMIEKELKIIYHQDNSFDKFYTYNINPSNPIDGIPLFNTYACKLFNDWEEQNK